MTVEPSLNKRFSVEQNKGSSIDSYNVSGDMLSNEIGHYQIIGNELTNQYEVDGI